MAGKGVEKLVKRIDLAALGSYRGLRKDGPVHYAKSGPWRVEIEGKTGRLLHYGTKMLEWKYGSSDRGLTTTIIGTWTGWGSVSDQTGVNAALSALGSTMRYSRDIRGGGPRINPYAMRAGGGIRPQTPPVY